MTMDMTNDTEKNTDMDINIVTDMEMDMDI
jgi:hypothetical protein